jgi:hypothetical protein
MTEFEIAYMFTEISGLLSTNFMNFASLTFAFLVSSVLGAQRLSRPMAFIALALYSLLSLAVIYQIYRTLIAVVRLGQEIKEKAQLEGSALKWHVLTDSGDLTMAVMPLLPVAIMIIAFCASLYFFKECRSGKFRL